MVKNIFGFFASDKTPDSSFYLTLLAILGIIGQALSTAASPQLIAIGTMLVGLYTVGHKIAEALGATKKVDPQSAASLADAVVQKQLQIGIRLPPPAMAPVVMQVPGATVHTPAPAAKAPAAQTGTEKPATQPPVPGT